MLCDLVIPKVKTIPVSVFMPADTKVLEAVVRSFLKDSKQMLSSIRPTAFGSFEPPARPKRRLYDQTADAAAPISSCKIKPDNEDTEEGDLTYQGGLVQAGQAANRKFGSRGGAGVTTEAQLQQAHRTLESSLCFVSC